MGANGEEEVMRNRLNLNLAGTHEGQGKYLC
jgi:hypothetical protein